MTHQEIAKQLHELNENIILIYAFNSTGKTRLSIAYKDHSKEANGGEHAGVYYNAYSEDLFVWDNDEPNDNADIKFNVIKSSLNPFHAFLTEELVLEKLQAYRPRFTFSFDWHDNTEEGIRSISFCQNPGEPFKISRGEERIFVWCFFQALFDVEDWSSTQGAHILIDDPVSSLDEHNIFVTSESIMDIIEASYESKRIIISTHHIGLFSILFDCLRRGDRSGKFKHLTKAFILSNKGGDLQLKSPSTDVFLYHLHLLQTLENDRKQQLYKYHMVLLRQALENIASFLGAGRIGFVLSEIGVKNVNTTMDRINSLSHKNAYQYQIQDLEGDDVDLFNEVFDKLLTKYNFKLH